VNILIIEDDLNKLGNIKEYVESFFKSKHANCDVIIKNSFQSGLKEILTNTHNLVLLDMSLPNFDMVNNDGGVPLSKGGELILYEMDIMGINPDTIIVTQHDDFDGESLETINAEYKKKFPQFYKGYVFYNAVESNWKKELELLLNKAIND